MEVCSSAPSEVEASKSVAASLLVSPGNRDSGEKWSKGDDHYVEYGQ